MRSSFITCFTVKRFRWCTRHYCQDLLTVWGDFVGGKRLLRMGCKWGLRFAQACHTFVDGTFEIDTTVNARCEFQTNSRVLFSRWEFVNGGKGLIGFQTPRNISATISVHAMLLF